MKFVELIKTIEYKRVGRFLIAGSINTIVNFTVLNVAFDFLRIDKIVSSIIAVTAAVMVSFLLNRNFVFKDKSETTKKLINFLLLSAISVLVIQNLIYILAIDLLFKPANPIGRAIKSLIDNDLSVSVVNINLSNAVAVAGVTLWNYNVYRLLVFKNGTNRHRD